MYQIFCKVVRGKSRPVGHVPYDERDKGRIKIATLIAVVVCGDCSPRKPKDLTYAATEELLRNHFQRTSSALAKR